MPLIDSLVNDATEGKATSTLNGITLFVAGPFYGQYGTGVVITGASDWSVIFSQLTATANTVGIPTASAANTAINMSSDPTGKSPQASMYLPGSSILSVPTGPYGALALGTVYNGNFYGKFNNASSTPTIRARLYLRNASTGAIAYTIADTTSAAQTSSGSDQSLIINPTFCVTSVTKGAGTIVGFMSITAGGTDTVSAPTVTTVDTTQSYILDLGFLWSTAGSNTSTIYFGDFETIV
jgi:hypothetical protein